MTSKAQMGHVALHEILNHERSCFDDIARKHYMGNNTYEALRVVDPDLYDRALGRWKKARDFAEWAMDAYMRQINDQPAEE